MSTKHCDITDEILNVLLDDKQIFRHCKNSYVGLRNLLQMHEKCLPPWGIK